MGVTIRQLTIEDIPQVIAIQSELAIAADLIARDETVAERGMLISGHDEAMFQRYLDEGGRLFGGSVGEDLAGYALVIPGRLFTPKLHGARLTWSGEEIRDRISLLLERGTYLYCNQLGVRWKHQRAGVGSALMARIAEECRGEDLIALIMTAPLRNVASMGAFERFGFRTIAQVHFERFRTLGECDGILVWKRAIGADSRQGACA